MGSQRGHQYSEATPFKQQALRDLLGVYLHTLPTKRESVLVDANAGFGWVEERKEPGSPLEIMQAMLQIATSKSGSISRRIDFHTVEKDVVAYDYLAAIVGAYVASHSWEKHFSLPKLHCANNSSKILSILAGYSKSITGLVYLDTSVPDFELLRSISALYPKLGILFTFTLSGFRRCNGKAYFKSRPKTLSGCLKGVDREWFANPYGRKSPDDRWRWWSVVGRHNSCPSVKKLRGVGYLPLAELEEQYPE
jgi:hypothetical protein